MEATCPYLLHALSPLHAGTGQAVDIIDLPIARMRSTGIPFVPGSSIKGVLREARRPTARDPDGVHQAVFGPLRGPEGDVDHEHAGALVVSDARLLALPVRSFRGTFALVTSPLLLDLSRRDLAGVPGLPPSMKPIDGTGARVASLKSEESVNVYEGKNIILEDLDLGAKADAIAAEWAKFIPSLLPQAERDLFRKRLVVVDDETMTFLWETATQLDTRIRIDPKTGTVAQGALWTEESLPPETLLIGVLAAERSHKPGVALGGGDVLAHALPGEEILQFGGKATIGRGRCRILPWRGEAGG